MLWWTKVTHWWRNEWQIWPPGPSGINVHFASEGANGRRTSYFHSKGCWWRPWQTKLFIFVGVFEFSAITHPKIKVFNERLSKIQKNSGGLVVIFALYFVKHPNVCQKKNEQLMQANELVKQGKKSIKSNKMICQNQQ